MRQIVYRQINNYDEKAASEEAAVDCSDNGEPGRASMCVQSMAEDADLNVIMRRFGVTGKLPENPRVPMYGDFTHITDYRSAIEAVRAADIAFMEFPAEIRSRFANDPQLLLQYVAADGGSSFQGMLDAFKSGSSDVAVGAGSGGSVAANGVASGGGPGGNAAPVGGGGAAAVNAGGASAR